MAGIQDVPKESGAPSGYPKDIVISGNVSEKFLCGICQLILKNPRQGTCGHRFCEDCGKHVRQKGAKEGTKPLCPACKDENSRDIITAEEIADLNETFPDRAINRDLSRLETKCLTPGCEWTGIFREYQVHAESCKPVTAECCQCGAEVPPDKQIEHLVLECLSRRTLCPYCEEVILARHWQTHVSECEKRLDSEDQDKPPVPCPKESLCPYGCPDVISSVAAFHDHEKKATDVHILYLFNGIKNFSTTNPTHGHTTNPRIEKQNQGEKATTDPPKFLGDLEKVEEKMSCYEDLNAVMVTEVEKSFKQSADLEKNRVEDRKQTDAMDKSLRSLERTVALKDITLAELELRLQEMEHTTFDGNLMWKISNVKRGIAEAKEGKVAYRTSPTFYTDRKGYKMCARVYLNGDGMGKGTHLSVFFIIKRGSYDPLLRWPFRQKVTLTLKDQHTKEDVMDSFRPDPTSSSFQRPKSEMNVASGCPMFLDLKQLDRFIKDDLMFLSVHIDTADM